VVRRHSSTHSNRGEIVKTIATDIAEIIEREVQRRVTEILREKVPLLIEPKPVDAPFEPFVLNDLGDSAKANGKFFALHMTLDRKRLQIHCPTFLRGYLGIRAERIQSISY
jgi:hypothetical protein